MFVKITATLKSMDGKTCCEIKERLDEVTFLF